MDTPYVEWTNTETTPLYVQIGCLSATLLCSSFGMCLLKFAQVSHDAPALLIGYTLEALALLFFMWDLQFFRLRIVTIVWSACNNITATIAGSLLFDEPFTFQSILGIALLLSGLVLVVRDS